MKNNNGILIASSNKGKIKEFKNLFKEYKIFSLTDLKINDAVEDGHSFVENALIKAKHGAKRSEMFTIADDSGLVVPNLNYEPGIYSARWGGKSSNFKKAMQKVYKELDKKDKEWKKKKILARFICALVIYWPNKKKIYSVGKVSGKISKTKKGKNGFGYDPIFIPNGHKRTFAEMSKIYKYKIDHRAKAFKKIKRFF